MKIIKKKIDSEPEKDLLIGLIVSDRFIREIFPILDLSYIQISYIKKIAGWCVAYYKKYNKAPFQDIEKIFKQEKRKGKLKDEMIELIEDFLIQLNKRYTELENFNEKYLIDSAEFYLKKRNMELLRDDLDVYLIQNEIGKAELLLSSHSRIEKLHSNYIDVIKDHKKIISSLMQDDNEIFSFPGALGELVGPVCRGDFFSFIAPAKRGKSWWLIDFAVRSLFKQLKVLFVSMEMPEKQLLQRIHQGMHGQSKKERHEIQIPFFTEKNELRHTFEKRKGLSVKKVIEKAKKLEVMIGQGQLNIVCYPSRSVNLDMIKNEIQNAAHYTKFYPDVIVIDYLDILKPEPSSPREIRHAIDYTWSTARGLAQEINCIVVTASQGNRSTFKKDIDEEGVAEDIRKLAHVTHMIALNQSKENKENNVMRLGSLVVREEEFFVGEEVLVAYQYGIGKAYLDSRWEKDVLF
ncbi:MAG: DnaB-like helicase C-terminal domain-containing protein [Nitrosopumilaceae archaeon]|jgi:hypothetical protein